MLFLQLPIAALVAYILWRTLKLYSNYQQACALGLPILISPVSWRDPFWMIFAPSLKWLNFLPGRLGHWVTFSFHGWTLQDRYQMHSRLGDAFVIVNPIELELWLANPRTVDNVLARTKDFLRDRKITDALAIFGPNTGTVEHADWQRHRKITSSSFNEQHNDMVWNEAQRQTRGMLRLWTRRIPENWQQASKDVRSLVLHVFVRVGFGRSYSFEQEIGKPSADHTGLGYLEALQQVLDNILVCVAFFYVDVEQSRWLRGLLPASLNRFATAMSELRKRLSEFVTEERVALREGRLGESNLMNALIRASDMTRLDAGEEKGGAKGRDFLTDNELYGNMFFFSSAGYETTASALNYALALLALQPDIQTWLWAEIDHVYGPMQKSSHDQDGQHEYQATFPRLKRCLALLHETLRFWGPVPATIKISPTTNRLTLYDSYTTSDHATVTKREIVIPAGTIIRPNSAALHHNPAVWGPDVMDWKPQRWIVSREDTSMREIATGSHTVTELDDEQFSPPSAVGSSASYLAWGVGPRVCPGKKFSQVEFVAVIATILREYRLVPAIPRDDMSHPSTFADENNSTRSEAWNRLNGCVQGSKMGLTPGMVEQVHAHIRLEVRNGREKDVY